MKVRSSNGAVRLPTGGQIDRSRPLRFTFDGLSLAGFAGDSLASALLANGVAICGRSFKYHRPRGLLACGVEEPNALVTVGTAGARIPLARATEVALYDGLVARAVNSWPNARADLGVILDRLHRFLPAGFYYKTFKWPTWRLYEPLIRRLAGLARLDLDGAEAPARSIKRRAWCDVLVVGGGLAGLAAARAAGRSGARVILVEQSPVLGGSLLWNGEGIDGLAGPNWVADVAAELAALGNVRLVTGATVFGYYDDNLVAALEHVDDGPGAAAANAPRERLWMIRAEQVVLATGAIERPLLFSNNDRPGIMLASAALEYLERFAVRAGERVVVATNNDSAYATAAAYALAGATVTIVDCRHDPGPQAAAMAARHGITVLRETIVVDARGAPVHAATLKGPDSGTTCLDCDLVCVSGGWNPAVHLFSQSGGKLRFDEPGQCFVPDHAAQKTRAAGACAGIFTRSGALADGAAIGAAAAADCGHGAASPTASAASKTEPVLQIPPLALPERDRDRVWIDFQNDVTLADIALSARENLTSVEHLKRYTTAGMAVDQGKTSNVTALVALGLLTGRTPGEVGTTTFRPPYVPISMAALAGQARGEKFHPMRLSPLHTIHAAAKAAFVDVAGWQRPDHFPRSGEPAGKAIRREMTAARNGVALFDASSLGKIELFGRDAGRFLDAVYVNTMSNLRVGTLRYGLLLDDKGIVADDGVCARLDAHRYVLSTTTGGAIATAAEFERLLQCEWPELDVLVSSVTSQWASIAVIGPSSRQLLERLGSDIPLDAAAFPHMTVREGHIAGTPARIFRVSFTGELSFEINVPATTAERVWHALASAGADLGLTPIGLGAIDALRIEKGYILVGGDTDGTTAPADLGLAPAIARRSGDFIGRRSLSLSHMAAPDRLQLVGLIGDSGREPPAIGALIGASRTGIAEGHVTSACLSPSLGRGIALGMLRNGRARHGERLLVANGTSSMRVTVTGPCFLDPQGERLRA